MRRVYFIRPVGAEGPVKIGCSFAPEGRLSSLMTWSPFPLEIVASVAGDLNLERRFHHRFAHLYSHREWFRAAPELSATIAAIQAGSFDTATLPSTGLTRPLNRRAPMSERLRRLTGINIRLNYWTNGVGLIAPDSVRLAARDIHGLNGPELERAIALINAYCDRPLETGTPAPYPWAAEKLAAYCARQGIDPSLAKVA